MLPVPIADGVLNDTLPEHTIQTARELKFFLGENAKSARAFLKFCGHPSPIASLSIEEIGHRPDSAKVRGWLKPALEGNDIGIVSEAGCPGVADPGAQIAAEAHKLGIRVVPLVGSLADTIDPAAMASLLGVTRADILADPASIFTAENLFAFIGKPLGIGGIAMAGIIGIVKQSKIIRQAVGLAVSELGGGNKTAPAAVERTQRDLTMKRILTILIATLISVFIFFHFGLLDGWVQSVTAILIVFVIAFLFTTVAANAIAIVGTNPVSGMTLMTLILSSLVLVSVGLSGTTGMTAALVIGGVVCTALSMAGGFITDLKIGYWLGTTPRKQEAWKFLGTFVAAATVAGVMIILNKSYGFVGEGAIVAPQANAMAAVIQPLMTGGQTPWMLYFCGAALALVLTSIGVPALAFALGMFIPMELNAPLVVGGLVAWFVSNRSKDEALNKARFDRGTLIASGFIAGGALMGVVSALLKFSGVEFDYTDWWNNHLSEVLSLVAYIALIIYFVFATRVSKKDIE